MTRLRCSRNRTQQIMIMTSMPATTPPAIAPVLVEEPEEEGELLDVEFAELEELDGGKTVVMFETALVEKTACERVKVCRWKSAKR